MNDLTLLLATANQINEDAAKKIRNYVLEVTENKYPIISVSQKPIDFGQNICVGEIGVSKYNEYKQILIGVREVKTKYVACIDDDTLYSPDHFAYRPPDDFFAYERNYWFAEEGKEFYWRVGDITKRGGMWGNISTTKALRMNLTKRFESYPTNPWAPDSKIALPKWWGEPGIHDEGYGIPNNNSVFFYSKNPCLIFVHIKSMGYKQLSRFYRRYGQPKPEDISYNLVPFGETKKLWDSYWS